MADTATDKVEDVAEEGKEKVTGNGNGSDSLKKILIPAAAGVGTLAPGYAAKNGKQAMDKMKDGGGVAGKVAGAVTGKLGGGNGDGGGKKTRRLPIQRYTDVAVPID